MKKKILLVEENEAISFLIETLLEKNYETLPVPDSNYAMKELFTNDSFDALIISIDSIGSGNFKLLHHISTSCVLRNIPVLVLSKSPDSKLEDACEANGVSAFLTKPFDPQVFVRRTDELTFIRPTHEVLKKKVNRFNLNTFF